MKIEAVSTKEVKTKRGMSPTYAFKGDDGQWYNCGFDNPSVIKGDEVEFDFESTKYGNKVSFESFKVVKKMDGAAPAAARSYGAKPAGGSYQPKPFPIPLLHGDRAIIRQNALTNARELVSCGMLKAETNGDGTIDEKTAVATIIRIARQFEAYSAGDVERMAADNVHKEKA
jgi:hypothetical protein